MRILYSIILMAILAVFSTSKVQAAEPGPGERIWEAALTGDGNLPASNRGYSFVHQVIADSDPDNGYIYMVMRNDNTTFTDLGDPTPVPVQTRWHIERRKKIHSDGSCPVDYDPDVLQGEWRKCTPFSLYLQDLASRYCWEDEAVCMALDETTAPPYLYVGGSKEVREGHWCTVGNDINDPSTYDNNLGYDADATSGWHIRKLNISDGSPTGVEYYYDPSQHMINADCITAMTVSGDYLYVLGVTQQDLGDWEYIEEGSPAGWVWTGRSRFLIAKLNKGNLTAAIAPKPLGASAETPNYAVITPGKIRYGEDSIAADSDPNGYIYICANVNGDAISYKSILMKRKKSDLTEDMNCWTKTLLDGCYFLALYGGNLYTAGTINSGRETSESKPLYYYVFQKRSLATGDIIAQGVVDNTVDGDSQYPTALCIRGLAVDASGIYAAGSSYPSGEVLWQVVAVPFSELKGDESTEYIIPHSNIWINTLVDHITTVSFANSVATDSKYVYAGGAMSVNRRARALVEKINKGSFIDIGLRVWTKKSITTGKPVTIAAYPKDQNSSPLRVFKTIKGVQSAYSIALVDVKTPTPDPYDSGVRIWVKDKSGIPVLKALRKFEL